MTRARRAAVLGHPIAHSLSPVIHRAGLAHLGLHEWSYEALDTDVAGLPARLASLNHSWAGLSLTMPLKRDALDHMDHIEPLALATGAMNTVLVEKAGAGVRLIGVNTDVYGITEALRPALAEESALHEPDGAAAVVVGGGATAASALAALASLGYRHPTVAVRSPGRAGALTRAAHRLGMAIDLLPLAALARRDWPTPSVVISTLPPGAGDEWAEAMGRLAPGVLLDVAYEPWPTVVCATWQRLGGRTVPGWEMLLWQAYEQFRLFTGQPAPRDVMRAALLAALEHRRG